MRVNPSSRHCELRVGLGKAACQHLVLRIGSGTPEELHLARHRIAMTTSHRALRNSASASDASSEPDATCQHRITAEARGAAPRVLLILGHPRTESLCGALAAAYQEGAEQAGAEVRRLSLAELAFDPHVRTVSPREQALESDLERALALIHWAEHVVLVFPGWWGTGPALLKGFLDRVLLPGDAFAERDDGGFRPLLGGRTAHLLVTLDMPPWVYRLIFRQPGFNAMKRSTLGFCGIRTTRVLAFGPVKDSDPLRRSEWLEAARSAGFTLRQGALTRGQRLADLGASWLRALRLQFYPMTWIAYTVGALAALGSSPLVWDAYWLGYGFLFFLELATVLGNDYFDYPSDRANRHHGTFTGGSRVLVESRLSFSQVRAGIGFSLAVALAALGLLLGAAPAAHGPILSLAALMAVLALGYTAPPLRLAWRGLGELDVGLTHSIGVMLCGSVFQGGAWNDPLPWLLSLPLFLAVLPAIILAGLPDLEADRAAGKSTLAVGLGARRATTLVLLAAAAAALAAALLEGSEASAGALRGISVFVLPHAALLCWLVHEHRRQGCPAGRIDRLLVAALSYIIWFGVVPFYHLA